MRVTQKDSKARIKKLLITCIGDFIFSQNLTANKKVEKQ